MTAKAPMCMVAPASVAEMDCGDSAAVWPTAILVKEGSREMFVRAEAVLVRPAPGRVSIWRDKCGFHIDVSQLERNPQWGQRPGWALKREPGGIRRISSITGVEC